MRPLPMSFVFMATVAAIAAVACTRAPESGRRQLLATSPQEENQMGGQAYQEAKSKEKVCTDPATLAFVQRVAERLERVATPEEPKGAPFQWEVTVFESNTVNAWCLPGGKIGVYTAILPYCENEAGLATVLGHEISHAIARHGGERMTSNAIAGFTGQALGAILQGSGVNPTATNLSLAAFGAGSQLGLVLPFSRKQEKEADDIGLRFMAKAGYDPAEAVKFWHRFAALTASGTPGFLSDHPTTPEREKDLQNRQPDAQKLYQAVPDKRGAGDAVPEKFRQIPPPAPKK